MKRNVFLMIGITAMILSGCKSKQTVDESQVKVSNNVRNNLDWAGTYIGFIPCADCSGIEIHVTLNRDGTYAMSQKYADHEGVFEDKGEFSWNKSGKTVTFSNLNDKTTMHFNVGENRITMLNEEGKKIKGILANNYILTKVDPGLRGKKWKLSELSGKEIEGQQEAFILLDATSNSVSGNLNCNNFTGNYELKPDNHIQFSNLAVTQKMCLKMEIEDGLKKMLESADSYSVTEKKLILICARKALIAEFVPAE